MDPGPSSLPWEEGEETVEPLFWSFGDELSSFSCGFTALVELPPLPPSLLLPPPLPLPPPAPETSFEGYQREEREVPGYSGGCSMVQGTVELPGKNDAGGDPAERGEGNRGIRHMISERRRREKMSKSYTDLRSLLPSPTKVTHPPPSPFSSAILRLAFPTWGSRRATRSPSS